MTSKNPQKQGRILEGGGKFFWLARIYTPVIMRYYVFLSLSPILFHFDKVNKLIKCVSCRDINAMIEHLEAESEHTDVKPIWAYNQVG